MKREVIPTRARPSRKNAVLAVAILAAVFAAGVIAGGAGLRLCQRGGDGAGGAAAPKANPSGCPGHSPDELVELFVSRLSLDPAQRATVEPILRRGWADIAAIYQRALPETDRVRTDARAAVRAVLRPEQLQKHDALVAEFDARQTAKRACRQRGIDDARALPRLRSEAPSPSRREATDEANRTPVQDAR